jgi:hypothetical protein
VCEPLLQAFPFPSTLGEVTLHQLSQACVFIYSSHGKWVFPPLLWSFLPPPLLEAFPPLIAGRVPLLLPSPAGLFIYSSHGKWVFPLSCGVFLPPPLLQAFPLLVAGHVTPLPPAFSVQLVYLQFCEGFPSPLFSAQGTLPSLLCVFFVVIAYYSGFFFSFFPGWGLVCLGGYADLAQGCLWEYRMPLSSPCGLHLPMLSGHWRLAVVWEPSWFLHLM